MFPDTNPAEVRAWYAERLDAAARNRAAARPGRAIAWSGLWRQLRAWLMPAAGRHTGRLRPGTRS